ncbi:MAG: hypothetical protein SOW59_07080 [Corynebacterium sp.]|nr:hypothetical protein [Corynebacterium sp.]
MRKMLPESEFEPYAFSKGEALVGLIWLSIAALLSLFLEVVYLGSQITFPDGHRIAFPVTIAIALWFNMVLTSTALRWTENFFVAATPLLVWGTGFTALLLAADFTGDMLLGNNIRTVGLLLAGIAGGIWPFVRRK